MLDWAGMLAGGGQLLGGIAGMFGGNDDAKDAAIINRNLQQRAMEKSIQYRVKDAIKAGIHPLYAVGAPTFSPASSYVGDSGADRGNALANMGQGIGRAVEAMQSTEKRHQSRMMALTEQRAELENTLLASQIRLATQPGQPPGFPSPSGSVLPGQGDTSKIQMLPKEIIHANPNGFSEVGVSPADKFVNVRGTRVTVPSDALQQAIEDTPAAWYYAMTRTVPEFVAADTRYAVKRLWDFIKDYSRRHPRPAQYYERR